MCRESWLWLGETKCVSIPGVVLSPLPPITCFNSKVWKRKVSCPVFLLSCLLVTPPRQSWSPSLSLPPGDQIDQSKWHPDVLAVEPDEVDQWVNVFWHTVWCQPYSGRAWCSLHFQICIHVHSLAVMAGGVQAYAQHQCRQCITLVYVALDGDLCDGLGVDFQCCFPQLHWVLA